MTRRVGDVPSSVLPSSDVPPVVPRLESVSVVRTYTGGAGVRGVDLAVAPGEIHALVGLNGAGKTTLMRALLGMLRPSSGTVRIDGRLIAEAGPSLWRSVGHLVETPFVYGELDVRTNLRIAARLHGIERSQAGAAADAVIDELGLGRYAGVRARRLSLGNRQRVGIAAALQHSPDLIVLDEPTNALDPAGVIVLREALLHRAASGASILVSSHHLDEVARVADRISVMNDGRIVGSLDPAAIDLEREFFATLHADDLERGAA